MFIVAPLEGKTILCTGISDTRRTSSRGSISTPNHTTQPSERALTSDVIVPHSKECLLNVIIRSSLVMINKVRSVVPSIAAIGKLVSAIELNLSVPDVKVFI